MDDSTPASGPLIGITADADAERFHLKRAYIDAVAAAGGVPVILPASDRGLAAAGRCDGLILSGGDDPDMTAFGRSTHPRATPIAADRQAFEVRLLEAADGGRGPAAGTPVLGICLGMQLMALVAGGDLDQHLPDDWPDAGRHWGHQPHAIRGALGEGTVSSHHRQAVSDPGRLEVTATADDGLIEAVRDPRHPWCVGVQWHPERTKDPRFGSDLLRSFVDAAAAAAGTVPAPPAGG